MVPMENKSLVWRFVAELWNAKVPELAGEYIAPCYVRHDPLAPPGCCGLEGFLDAFRSYRDAFTDLTITVDQMVAEAEIVVIRWTMSGTHTGQFHALAATGRQITVAGTSIIRVSGGRISEEWIQWDALGMLKQLGAPDASGVFAG